MGLKNLEALGLGNGSMIAGRTDWERYFNRRALTADHAASKHSRQIDNTCKKTQEKIKEVIHQAKGYCECCGRHYDEVYNDPKLKRPLNRMCIDHCHDTGEIRAYLCGLCNMAEGLFAHDPEALLVLYEHMKKSPKT